MPKPIVLKLRGVGTICSFKNTKMIARKRLITDPKKQEKMDAYIRAIALALFCAHQTDEIATATGCALPSWIRSSVPLDDSLRWIPESGGFKSLRVPKGQEGADIIIERIDDDIISDL